ncbi:MAG: hypothetical protein JXR76_19970 [Deltaproteobacteria bacterium]|nr:hypothetical protein [Deltaproteobacteria bacterium]
MTTWNKKKLLKSVFICALALLSLLLVCCGAGPEDGESSGDSDSDGDGDGDGDGDVDQIEEVGDLEGRTFVLDEIEITKWMSPAGLGKELGSSVPPMAFQITSAKDGKLTALLGIVDGDKQDKCNPTVEMTGTIDEDPDFGDKVKFELGPKDFEAILTYPGPEPGDDDLVVVATIRDLQLVGYLKEGATIYEGEGREYNLIATVDFRHIAHLFSGQVDDPDGDNLCEQMSDLYSGVKCEACPDDDEEYCVTLKGAQISATAVAGLDIKEVDKVGDGCVE